MLMLMLMLGRMEWIPILADADGRWNLFPIPVLEGEDAIKQSQSLGRGIDLRSNCVWKSETPFPRKSWLASG